MIVMALKSPHLSSSTKDAIEHKPDQDLPLWHQNQIEASFTEVCSMPVVCKLEKIPLRQPLFFREVVLDANGRGTSPASGSCGKKIQGTIAWFSQFFRIQPAKSREGHDSKVDIGAWPFLRWLLRLVLDWPSEPLEVNIFFHDAYPTAIFYIRWSRLKYIPVCLSKYAKSLIFQPQIVLCYPRS